MTSVHPTSLHFTSLQNKITSLHPTSLHFTSLHLFTLIPRFNSRRLLLQALCDVQSVFWWHKTQCVTRLEFVGLRQNSWGSGGGEGRRKGSGFMDSEVIGPQITSSPVRTRERTEWPGLENSYDCPWRASSRNNRRLNKFVCLFVWRRLFSSHSERGWIAGFCEHDNEHPGSINDL